MHETSTEILAPDGSCVFCAIASGSTPAATVLVEPRVVAFLDVAPVFPGHVLVVPRMHWVTLPELPVSMLETLFEAVQRVARAVEAVTGAQGTWVSMNNVVSQSVPHLHVHVVPRRRKDGLRGFYWPRVRYAEGEMDAMASALRTSLGQ